MPALGSCLLVLFVIQLVIFRDHWLGRSFFPFDFPAGYYGTVAYWITSVQSGEWPQWIPYQSMGYPLLMNPQIGLFYPPFWIFVLFRIPFTLHAAVIVQILHVLFGSIGILLLAGELFGSLLAAECGAAAFLFFGGFYTNAEHADIIRGFAWVPWLLWASLLDNWRLTRRNLLLPLFLACFITGAYAGQFIAGILLLGVFLIVQGTSLFLGAHDRRVWRTVAWQFALAVLGVLLASAFLVPEAALAGALTRSRGFNALPVHWLDAKGLFDLLFPSNFIDPVLDYSMSGMQLPIVLLLFMPLIELRLLKKLFPFLVVGSCATLMCFSAFSGFSNALRRLVPVLGLSRFPLADYREFLYLAVLLLATGGLASAIRSDNNPWRKAAGSLLITALFAAACLTCLQHDIVPASFRLFLNLAKMQLFLALGASLLLLVCCRLQKPQFAALALLPILTTAMLPIVAGAKPYWDDPNVVRALYGGPGRELQVNGELRTRAIFRRHEAARGPRAIGDNQGLLTWWGYLDGAYLTNDSGGVVPLTRTTVEGNPALLQFILQGSRIVQIPCNRNPEACSQIKPRVDLANQASAGSAVAYSRNSLAYQVDVPARSLVIENEMAIEGWQALVDGRNEPVRVVNDCLRGWVVPAGRHQVTLRYRTPFLFTGLLLSGCGLVIWIAAFQMIQRSERSKINADSELLLVSSDRHHAIPSGPQI